ncbi:alpha/beta fold hydrolase [Fluviispira multicolorata]|uniref:Alpha/beta fold hydrolase n=1 Tax=Fluviispira multicolorata TaxID=2654512 RepID=A0A833JDQ7_9BACT|nr:alpha/beta fold hydrolase [Fluviispira multicolorata]KAB8031993.1 alpha/beta fold hydrolase [Fluviispira multicolorata]
MINLHFIHGFLGFPNDWNIFKKDLINYNFKFHSISEYLPSTEDSSFKEWCKKFNAAVFNQKNKPQINILVGYSLGGRLALRAILESNDWNAGIIISANPGLKNENDRQVRLLNDSIWANRFLNENWDDVMNSWNSQGVFANIKNILKREESDFNRYEVAQILNYFSLGRQENLREKISTLHIPILWLAGENDIKFAEISDEMKQLNSCIQNHIIKDAGHRVPWESPHEFKEKLFSFLNKL